MGFVQERDVKLIEAVHLGANTTKQLRGVGLHRPDGDAVGMGIGELMVGLGAIDQQLLRHATADHAGATDAIAFNDGHPHAMPRRTIRCRKTA